MLAVSNAQDMLCRSHTSITSLEIKLKFCLQGTWLGRWLNNFQWFYWTHVFLFVVFVGALLVHPLPGLPGHQHTTIHSVTWARDPRQNYIPLSYHPVFCAIL